MSNRTLIEINHDLTGPIDRTPADFVDALVRYLKSGDRAGRDADKLRFVYGVRIIGMRHHSDPYTINWGGHKDSQP